MIDCPFCVREARTRVYYEDDKVWIVSCESCKMPMAVWKEHLMNPSVAEKHYACNTLMRICGRMFREPVYLDETPKRVPLHWRVHMRLAKDLI